MAGNDSTHSERYGSGDADRGLPFSRRDFLSSIAAGWMASSVTSAAAALLEPPAEESFDVLSRDLLRDWCDGMLKQQIIQPGDATKHGALNCPACGIIHGRCMDAVYPFLHMARDTGERKYRDAGVAVFQWSENVSQDDGSWTVVADPKSWSGITVFGAIALAEALHHHGELLERRIHQAWMERLGRAGDYIHATFTTLDFSNINYGCTGVHALNLLGRILNRPEYLERSRQLASQVGDFVTRPNHLLFGEGKPARRHSLRGCLPVDLGYNVEESLVSLALCAEATQDKELTEVVTRMLHAHLEFMLPDGGWDNSWGTRQAKWTYWGSRTSDGCQPGFAVFADWNPVFGTAVIENTKLYRRCTKEGLLHGGPHYISRGIKPCIHHTFTHAKALAAVRDRGNLARRIRAGAPLPRTVADGVREYPEISTWLAARGPWRATVTSYDWVYDKQVQQPTGGALSLLWHALAGPLLAGSMARYHPVEPYNMQPNPDPADHPLTPRVEIRGRDKWFTQLYDLGAKVIHTDKDGAIEFHVEASLLDESRRHPPAGQVRCSLSYRFDRDATTITAGTTAADPVHEVPRLVIPVISSSGEKVVQAAANRIEIRKPECLVTVEANTPIRAGEAGRLRIFNLVPGFEAVPITAEITPGSRIEIKLRVSTN